MKRFFAFLMSFCLLFLAGCTTKTLSQETSMPSADLYQTKNTETTLGYIPAEISKPDCLESLWGWDTYGDTIWLGAQSLDGSLLVASYDTINDQWSVFELKTYDAHNPSPINLSVTKDSFWILFRESYSESDIKNGARLDDLGYYILCTKLEENRSTCTRVPFEGESSSESSDSVICSVQALDKNRALLTTYTANYLIDSEANLLGQSELPIVGEISHMRIDNQLYILFKDGYTALDESSLQLKDIIPLKAKGSFDSNAGSILVTEHKTLYRYDFASDNKTEIFKWMDVALSYREMGGSKVFENSAGTFFYPTSKNLIKVTQSQIPKKQTLTLLCFGNSSDEMYQYQSTAYTYTGELMDAIVRFNNTDPEFKIEIKPVVYSNESERDRLLIELATAEDIDIVDTSLLPENAIKEGLFVDMLPFIDADKEISRDDFIQPLLNAMLKNGALYEYTDKFTLLTIIARQDLLADRSTWTVDDIRGLESRRPDLDCLSRERMLDSFILAATAEFIDWGTMKCSFDSPVFQSWLTFLKEQPEVIERYENSLLFQISTDLAGDAGFWARTILESDYVVPGFPEASGTGSYFVKLNGPFSVDAPTVGNNTRLGILASSKYPDGAWRFVRTLMLWESEANIMTGIPVLKERFERAVDTTVTDQSDPQQNVDIFNENDAQILREQVYNTEKLVHKDEALLNIIRSEATLYFEDQKSVEEATQQIQSRISIYLAEQS